MPGGTSLRPYVLGAPSNEQLNTLANRKYLISASGGTQTSASTTPVLMTGASLTVVKHYPGAVVSGGHTAANSGTLFSVMMMAEMSVTTAGATANIGVRFSEIGGASTVIDTLISRKRCSGTDLDISDIMCGWVSVTAATFPSGSYTVKPYFFRNAGTGTVQWLNNAYVELFVREVIL